MIQGGSAEGDKPGHIRGEGAFQGAPRRREIIFPGLLKCKYAGGRVRNVVMESQRAWQQALVNQALGFKKRWQNSISAYQVHGPFLRIKEELNRLNKSNNVLNETIVYPKELTLCP